MQNFDSKAARFIAMDHEVRGEAIGKMLWGYEDEALTKTDLIDILKIKHGLPVAQAFFDTMSAGFKIPASSFTHSFASACARYEAYQTLEEVLDCLDELKHLACPPQAATATDLLDHLSTRIGDAGDQIYFSMFQLAAAGLTEGRSSRLFAFALKHQPAHPHIAWVLGEPHPDGRAGFSAAAAALLREQMMHMQVDSALQSDQELGNLRSPVDARPKRAL
ncbi:hypothetical protein ABIC83_002540 [Roseateles asaccharophilus]|uniref:hypothetical protein n=1 Tax=Roseateles asaccharophilus TaxID=582607 RepID=UPI00383998DC